MEENRIFVFDENSTKAVTQAITDMENNVLLLEFTRSVRDERVLKQVMKKIGELKKEVKRLGNGVASLAQLQELLDTLNNINTLNVNVTTETFSNIHKDDFDNTKKKIHKVNGEINRIQRSLKRIGELMKIFLHTRKKSEIS